MRPGFWTKFTGIKDLVAFKNQVSEYSYGAVLFQNQL
jgi:hypothetical protein